MTMAQSGFAVPLEDVELKVTSSQNNFTTPIHPKKFYMEQLNRGSPDLMEDLQGVALVATTLKGDIRDNTGQWKTILIPIPAGSRVPISMNHYWDFSGGRVDPYFEGRWNGQKGNIPRKDLQVPPPYSYLNYFLNAPSMFPDTYSEISKIVPLTLWGRSITINFSSDISKKAGRQSGAIIAEIGEKEFRVVGECEGTEFPAGFAWQPLDGHQGLILLKWNGGGSGNNANWVILMVQKQPFSIQKIQTLPSYGEDIGDEFADLDEDGIQEFLVITSHGEHRENIYYPEVHQWDGHIYREASHKFINYYRDHVLPSLRKDLEGWVKQKGQWQYDHMAENTREIIRRVESLIAGKTENLE